ncbi:sulfate adenylyltransferase subunit CysN [Telmatospirillum sp. J64-1]|uniref:sulfate adenylyltransferase subunit CysN n=1 Tax=Telmatospirillum sp. J64-1 TaxID=2502183 RepID=UPI00115E1FEA|nr:sulfate adenylyltransferase subunit CysN [Telmatospirillum sp. J64-1]
MTLQSRATAELAAYLEQQGDLGLLRFITCGSVDDGKSTLIGRLLYDSKMIFEDQLAQLEADSRRIGTTGGQIDLALLVDGLQAEREQGITIDVAYRFFATNRRKFVVADTPGHEQYTRNMATGASTAQLAVILVDARKGVLTQTRRHSMIVGLLGIRHVVLAVNKMDLVEYSQARFEEIAAEFAEFAKQVGIPNVQPIPMSALTGDNVLQQSRNMPWYDGPTLLSHLETVDVTSDDTAKPFRMPVQWVNRPNQDFRGYAGTVVGGKVRPGDRIVVLPSMRQSSVQRIVTFDGDLDEAVAGDAVTLTLADEIDIAAGDVIALADQPAEVSDQFAAHLLWMGTEPMLPGRQYLLRIGAVTVPAEVTELKYKINVNTLEHLAGKALDLNELAFCNLALDHAVAFDPYEQNRDMGGFILIDRFTNATVGAGMIAFGLRRATNLAWHKLDVDKEARAKLKGQSPCVLWFTGFSGSGKSTIANLVEKKLHALGRHTYVLDGDNVRHGLNKDLGFTEADRVENIRRIGEVAKLFVDAGMITITAFISPFRAERRMARELMGEGEFIEVFIDTPLEECEKRDPKGLYKKARAGKLANFTGIDSAYEPPETPELVIRTQEISAEDAAEKVVAMLRERGYI